MTASVEDKNNIFYFYEHLILHKANNSQKSPLTHHEQFIKNNPINLTQSHFEVP